MKSNRVAGKLEGAKAYLTSVARFFVKTCFHKKCGVFEACKKVTDFFNTLKK